MTNSNALCSWSCLLWADSDLMAIFHQITTVPKARARSPVCVQHCEYPNEPRVYMTRINHLLRRSLSRLAAEMQMQMDIGMSAMAGQRVDVTARQGPPLSFLRAFLGNAGTPPPSSQVERARRTYPKPRWPGGNRTVADTRPGTRPRPAIDRVEGLHRHVRSQVSRHFNCNYLHFSALARMAADDGDE